MAENLTAQVELRALQAIADAVASSRDLSVVSQRVAEAIAGGRSTRDVYVYVYDANTNELVLTGGTESPAARQVGNLRVAYGDGVTGWVAASRQSYLVADQPQLDPHFMAYPGIGEERWGAIFSVPIVSLGDDLLGCITVWATSGNRFDPDEVPFVERVAALIVGTFETARLLDSDRHYQHVSDGLAELASMVASDTSTAPTLDYATELARVAVGADIAIMLVTDPSGADRMYIKVAPTTDEHLRTTVDTARQALLGVEQEIRNGTTSWHAASGKITQALERLTAAVSTAPIRVGSYELGIMACYRIESARFSNQGDATVATIANQAAVALKMTLLSDELYERNSLNWFLRDLSSGRESPEELRRRAASVGLDNGNRYLFVVGSVAAQQVTGVEVGSLSLGSGLKQLLMQIPEIPSDTQYATTPYQTVAVLPWHRDEDSIDALRLPLLDVCAHVRATTGAALTFGVSRPVATLDDLRNALAEAREAMAIGGTLDNPNGVFTLDDVGHHLLLSRVSGAGSVRDRYATAIGRIAEYDRVKGTELLETVAVFLHFRSQSAASRELFVHRNTLNQRLTRASHLCGFDILASSEWFPLQLALKVHQARAGAASNDPRRDPTRPPGDHAVQAL